MVLRHVSSPPWAAAAHDDGLSFPLAGGCPAPPVFSAESLSRTLGARRAPPTTRVWLGAANDGAGLSSRLLQCPARQAPLPAPSSPVVPVRPGPFIEVSAEASHPRPPLCPTDSCTARPKGTAWLEKRDALPAALGSRGAPPPARASCAALRQPGGLSPAMAARRGRDVPPGLGSLLLLLLLLLPAPHLIVTGCHEATFSHFAQEFCLSKFKSNMGTLRQTLWCDWDKTSGWYQELVNCTSLVTTKVDCYWPSKLVDEFFIAIHQHYFKNCPASGRSLYDPPNTVLCSFIVVPIFVTLLMTALVVWRSKHSEGII